MIIVDIKRSTSGVPVLHLLNAGEVSNKNLVRRGETLMGPGFQPFVGTILSTIGVHTLTHRARKELQGQEETSSPYAELDVVFQPYKHQEEGLRLMVARPRMAIFWEPGLGKTYVSCNRILHLRKSNPRSMTLILALRVNLSTWTTEMRVHSRGAEEARTITGTNKKARKKKLDKAASERVAAIVMTYESARSSVEDLLGIDYICIIADECHKMQNPNSGITKAALALSEKADYRYVLTGTPTKGRPTDAWGYLRFLGSFVVENFYKFRQRHVSFSKYNKHIVTGYRDIKRVNSLLDSVSHSVKNSEAVDLPPRTFQIVYVKPNARTRKCYNSVAMKDTDVVNVGGEDIDVSSPVVVLNKLCQIHSGFVYKDMRDKTICDKCPHMKNCVSNSIRPYTSKCLVVSTAPDRKILPVGTDVIDAATELVTNHIENGKKVILWARYVHTLNSLYSNLRAQGLEVLRYDSTTTDHGLVEADFNAAKEPCILLAQISMGIGVTFKAPIMIYTELPLALDRWLQSLDRNWGIRAKGLGNILVQILLIPNSVYAGIYSMLKDKIDAARIMADRPDCLTCPQVSACKAPMPFKGECIYTDRITKNNIETGRFI
jgi:SNF2 family DNA or RNA helicase